MSVHCMESILPVINKESSPISCTNNNICVGLCECAFEWVYVRYISE